MWLRMMEHQEGLTRRQQAEEDQWLHCAHSSLSSQYRHQYVPLPVKWEHRWRPLCRWLLLVEIDGVEDVGVAA